MAGQPTNEDRKKERYAVQPSELGPDTIGSIVVIQTFDRVAPGSDDLVENSLRKFVGFLQAYAIKQGTFCFRFEGEVGYSNVDENEKYVEIWVREP